MTSKDETRQSIAAIYDASESALREACADYASIVGVIVKPVAGEHYVTSRVKARRSLIRKLAKDGGGSMRGWSEISDKVGVRVICSTKRERKAAARALEQHGWVACHREDKKAGTQKLEYTGIHLTVDDGEHKDSLGGAILCEVQVRTRAQDAWSVVSHKLTYKGFIKLPRSARRVVWRLSVLAEMFDDDIQRMFKKRESMPEYEIARALEYLDDKFGAMLGEPGAGPGDLDIMSVLWSAYTPDEQASFSTLISDYLAGHQGLSEQIRSHQPGETGYMESRDWLSTQPEVLAVLERASSNEYLLAEAVAGTELADAVYKACSAYGIHLPD